MPTGDPDYRIAGSVGIPEAEGPIGIGPFRPKYPRAWDVEAKETWTGGMSTTIPPTELGTLNEIFNRYKNQLMAKAPLIEKILKHAPCIMVFDPEKETLEVRDARDLTRVYASKPLNELDTITLKSIEEAIEKLKNT